MAKGSITPVEVHTHHGHERPASRWPRCWLHADYSRRVVVREWHAGVGGERFVLQQ